MFQEKGSIRKGGEEVKGPTWWEQGRLWFISSQAFRRPEATSPLE
jgi:hypothetical protein